MLPGAAAEAAQDIAAAPPSWWGRGKARREVEQARKVAAGLRGIDPVLAMPLGSEETTPLEMAGASPTAES